MQECSMYFWRIFFFFFTLSWQVVDSFFLFNDRFPFWISKTKFHRENYFDSARMRDVRRESRLAKFHWTVRDNIKSPKRELIFSFTPIFYEIQFYLHYTKPKKNICIYMCVYIILYLLNLYRRYYFDLYARKLNYMFYIYIVVYNT